MKFDIEIEIFKIKGASGNFFYYFLHIQRIKVPTKYPLKSS